MMDMIIKNGIIVTSEKTYKSDIALSKGKITEISANIIPGKNTQIIDANGCYIFPGGIDPHVHMNLSVSDGFSSDDFYTGSKAALYGANTTIIDFVTPRKEQNLTDALNQRKKDAEISLIDYSFHVSPVDWHLNIEQEIDEIIQAGITSFKVYLAYKDSIGINDDILFKVMKTVSKAGGVVTVHAENGDEIEKLRDEFGRKDKLSPEYHALSRPNRTEADAVQKVIKFSEETSCKVYIVHVSTKESLRLIEDAQKAGLSVFAETCPQYLLLDDSKLYGKFEEAVGYVFTPPLRKNEDCIALWNGMKNKTIQTVGTDHCPFFFHQKELGKNDFRKIPGGAGGVEHRLSLLYTYGVLTGKINLNDFVALMSTNPAKIFGLYPKKGETAIGSDADIVIWNPNLESVISADNHHQNSDINIYEGFKVKGKPEYVIANGKIVLDKNGLNSGNCKSEFLKRKPLNYINI